MDSVSGNSEMLKDIADAVTATAEHPSLTDLGLGGWSPIGLVQHSLESITNYVDVPWISSIVILTAALRLVMVPLIIKAQINTARLNNIKPQIDEIQAKLRELMNSQDSVAKATATLKLRQLYQDQDCHPVKVCAQLLAKLEDSYLFLKTPTVKKKLKKDFLKTDCAGIIFTALVRNCIFLL